MSSDKMESNEGVTNYKAITTGLVNKISQSVIKSVVCKKLGGIGYRNVAIN